MTYLSVIHGVELKVKMDEKNRDLKGDPFVERLRSRLPREFRTKGKQWHFRTVYPDEPCPKSIRIDLLPVISFSDTRQTRQDTPRMNERDKECNLTLPNVKMKQIKPKAPRRR